MIPCNAFKGYVFSLNHYQKKSHPKTHYNPTTVNTGSINILNFIILIGLLLLPCDAFTSTENIIPALSAFEVDYEISRNGLVIIEMKRRLIQLSDGHYRYESKATPSKIISWLIKDRISETSYWHYYQSQPRPLHYQYIRSGGNKKKHTELEFNWTTHTVSDTQRTPLWQRKITANTSDKLLYQLQLMLDLQAGKKKFSYAIADSGKISHYDFILAGHENISLPLGRFATVKLQRKAGRRSTTIWFAPKLNFLPVRIEHREKDGSRMRADAIRVVGLPYK